MSHRYWSNSQVSWNGGVTSSISASEKSVVMFSFVSGAPRAAGCRVWEILPAGVARSDSFSTPLRPPRSTARSPELTSPETLRSNFLSTDRAMCLGYQQPVSRELDDDLDFNEEAGIHEPLNLHPRYR